MPNQAASEERIQEGETRRTWPAVREAGWDGSRPRAWWYRIFSHTVIPRFCGGIPEGDIVTKSNSRGATDDSVAFDGEGQLTVQ